jgi:excisionase family DNA binding protein
MEPGHFLKVSTVAQILDMSQSGIYNLIRHGDLPAIRIGEILRVPAEAVKHLMNQARLQDQSLARDTTVRSDARKVGEEK